LKITLEIISCHSIWDKTEIKELNERLNIPDAMMRRRLTRSSKILIYLANKVEFISGKAVFATEFGECGATSEIMNAILNNTNISPTAFQNSVHNTPASYLSILSSNTGEFVTVSDFGADGTNILKVAAIKALFGDEILIACVDALNIKEIEKINKCKVGFLEAGVALKVSLSDKQPNIEFSNKSYNGFLKSFHTMLELCESFENNKTIFEVEI